MAKRKASKRTKKDKKDIKVKRKAVVEQRKQG